MNTFDWSLYRSTGYGLTEDAAIKAWQHTKP